MQYIWVSPSFQLFHTFMSCHFLHDWILCSVCFPVAAAHPRSYFKLKLRLQNTLVTLPGLVCPVSQPRIYLLAHQVVVCSYVHKSRAKTQLNQLCKKWSSQSGTTAPELTLRFTLRQNSYPQSFYRPCMQLSI